MSFRFNPFTSNLDEVIDASADISNIIYGISWDGVIDKAPSKNVVYDEMETKSNKTTVVWSKSIGSGGDYATWAAMIADMSDLIAHAVTVTIKAGTTLTETCNLKNKHGLTSDAVITIQAEKYFPTSGSIPTADSATATTLRDAALTTAALGNDYFNGCWVFIVDGTGTDNGFVPITDYVDATGDVVVASWPGTQPDNTSRYLIVGALIECGGTIDNGFHFLSNTVNVKAYGIGVNDADTYGILSEQCFFSGVYYCGVYESDYAGVGYLRNMLTRVEQCGIIKNNIDNLSVFGGIYLEGNNSSKIRYNGISDNSRYGVICTAGGFNAITSNFGDANGAWGTYANRSAQAYCSGTECSGSSGNHSDPGTAGTASADQASAY